MSSMDDAQTSKRPLPQTGAAPQSSEHFDGARTKFGRRERKTKDKATKNARVRNSYLKLTMEDAVWDQLHRLVQQARDQWDEQNKSTENLPLDIVSKKQSRRQLAIKPRSRNSLHMTYFFAGKVLDEMSVDELQRWDAMIRQCVLDHSSRFDVGDYWLRFKHLATFPPQRPNLIAAVFESSPALDSLYQELCTLSMMEKEGSAEEEGEGSEADGEQKSSIKYEFPLLRSLTWKQFKKRRQHHSQPSWIAHVTLGNLAGGSKEDVRRLTQWLRDRESKSVDHSTTASNGLSAMQLMTDDSKAPSNDGASGTKTETSSVLDSDIKVLGLALGGPIPEHACDVDWSFPFYCADTKMS